MRRFYSLRTLCVLLCISFFLCSIAEKRVALIWGNADYKPDWQKLPNCINDADAMYKILVNMGFTTYILKDGNKNAMEESYNELKKIIKDADVAVFYYSGHATHIFGTYCLVPARTELNKDDTESKNYFTASDIEALLARHGQLKNKVSIIIYDACRDNLLESYSEFSTYNNQLNQSITETNQNTSPTKGLVTPKIGYPRSDKYSTKNNNAQGLLKCYATAPGQVAYAGEDGLSPFTEALLQHMYDGDDFITVFKNVQARVRQQEPAIVGAEDFIGKFFFNPGGKSLSLPTSSNRDEQTKITITSNAPNAKVVINGKKYDTGKALPFVIGTKYVYTVEADGYEPKNDVIDVSSATPSNLNVTLNKAQKSLFTITSTPNANVFLDGKKVGRTPLNIETTSGIHTLLLNENGYYDYQTQVEIKPGSNSKDITLSKKPQWFFSNDQFNDVTHSISYAFSPKFQLGLDYMYRFECSRFSLGAWVAFSPTYFQGTSSESSFTKTSSSTGESVSHNGQVISSYTKTTTTMTGNPSEYSEEIDPYHEAKVHDSNALILLNAGYNLCNGIMFEVGAGAAHTGKKTYMPCSYTIKKTVTTDDLTGEIVGTPEYSYTKNDGSVWYEGTSKWSPAMRLGLRMLIPINKNNLYLNIGGGYTYLFSDSKNSSWDATIGISFSM